MSSNFVINERFLENQYESILIIQFKFILTSKYMLNTFSCIKEIGRFGICIITSVSLKLVAYTYLYTYNYYKTIAKH